MPIHDPDHLWRSADRSSRTYPLVDTCYRYNELADTLTSLTAPERLPF